MKVIKFKPTYIRDDGLVVIYDFSIPFPKGFEKKISGLIVFPPKSKGGNHRHPRVEYFVSNDELMIVWLDKKGKIFKDTMEPVRGIYKLFITSPGESHAVVNNSNKTLSMMEFSDEPQYDVEKVDLA